MDKEVYLLGKKGQVTIFVIIAILVVAGVILYFTLREGTGEERQIPPEAQPVHTFVKNCLDESVEDTIERIGTNGGMYESKEPMTEERINYFIYEEQKVMPSLEVLESEISKGVKQRIPFCIQDFYSLPEYNINEGNMKVKTIINENQTNVVLDYPLGISKGNFNITLNKFESTTNVRLRKIYNSINSLIDTEMNLLKTDPDYGFDSVCWRCFVDVAGNNSLSIELYPDFEKEEVLFVVEDDIYNINEKPFEFWYVNKYRGDMENE